MTVDLRQLQFMDRSGLKVLVAAELRARMTGGSLHVVCGEGPVKRLLALTGLDRRLDLADEAALTQAVA